MNLKHNTFDSDSRDAIGDHNYLNYSNIVN